MTTNKYTLRHYEANSRFFWVVTSILLLCISVQLLKQIRMSQNRCLRKMQICVFFILRLAILFYFFGVWVPNLAKMWIFEMQLTNTNVYVKGDKTFLWVSNASPVNCIACWILYFLCMWLGLLFGILGLMIIILLCQKEFGSVIKWLKSALYSYLFNTSWPG